MGLGTLKMSQETCVERLLCTAVLVGEGPAAAEDIPVEARAFGASEEAGKRSVMIGDDDGGGALDKQVEQLSLIARQHAT